MASQPGHSGDMSHSSERAAPHLSGVTADASSPTTDATLRPAIDRTGSPFGAIDPAARQSKRVYQGLSASSVGLELGIAVILGLLFGMWLDRELGTEPWMMILFLVLGLVAGFRNVLRAVARAEKAAL